ncbi:MAG: hypothetical protein LQ342_001868 [Letrouitia transgressa]|nr:MAG: hypothetical protein LQ342_001868 [Letrouitia transgressa]
MALAFGGPKRSSDPVLIHPSANGLAVASPSITKGALSIFSDNSTDPNSQNIPPNWASYCAKPAQTLCKDLSSPSLNQTVNNVWVWEQFHGGCLIGGFLPAWYAPENDGLEDPEECQEGYLGPMRQTALESLGANRVSVNVWDFPTAPELPGTAVDPGRPRWIMQG